jgi:hypothetical protein
MQSCTPNQVIRPKCKITSRRVAPDPARPELLPVLCFAAKSPPALNYVARHVIAFRSQLKIELTVVGNLLPGKVIAEKIEREDLIPGSRYTGQLSPSFVSILQQLNLPSPVPREIYGSGRISYILSIHTHQSPWRTGVYGESTVHTPGQAEQQEGDLKFENEILHFWLRPRKTGVRSANVIKAPGSNSSVTMGGLSGGRYRIMIPVPLQSGQDHFQKPV